ncbi:MAG: DEAD/DEAH box helicase [Chlamydiales bacterium]|nr:DEAD/DEAH box helicase [Chlamydiales bacterium]
MLQMPFLPEDLSNGKVLFEKNSVKNIIFSDRTYQIEVCDLDGITSYWTFLQLTENALPKDYFCTCHRFESHFSCPHVSAAYLKIFNKTNLPIHVRFQTSIWNQLCQIEARRHGYGEKTLEKVSKQEESIDHYVCTSSQDKISFAIYITKEDQKKKIREIVFDRAEETEESSLKFSNLSQEELTAWRRGRPSHQLRYELSFWSDIAKYMMWLYEEKKWINFEFKGGDLPSIIQVNFDGLSMQFFIAKVNWPDIIPSLIDLPAPLKVYPFQKIMIKRMRYDESRHAFILEKESLKIKDSNQEKIVVDDWLLVPGDGFYPKEEDPLLNQDRIEEKEVSQFLFKYPHLLEKYLSDIKIHTTKIKPSYHLYFDSFDRLYVIMFLFELGDLTQDGAHIFSSWVYIPKKGFYLLEDQLFDGAKKIIERGKIGEFVSHHRIWLNQYEGFQTHLANIETTYRFFVDESMKLHIHSEMSVEMDSINIKDFGEWIYIPKQGFYSKASSRTSHLPSSIAVPKEEVTSFIHGQQHELEHIKGFFSQYSPVEKSGLEISFSIEGHIVITPKYVISPNYIRKQTMIFEEYSYVEGEGFCLIPPQARLPKEFRKDIVISSETKQHEFITEELEKLRPYILLLDTKLKKPNFLSLQMSHIKQDPVTGKWLVSLVYKTEFGTFPAALLWKAIRSRKRLLMTKAGLFLLKQPRFDWLKTLPNEKFSGSTQQFELSTIELMRLKIFEDIQIMPSEDPVIRKVISLFQGTYDPTQDDMPDITGLQSKLRPYQEIGVKWLWYLYEFSMSGLLADDMGLGKTHQAMALLAAIINQDQKKQKKFLVICPTSVIYHWEDLLERFLPDAKILVFYGSGRSLSRFSKNYHLLLTSYGTLRSEKDEIAQIQFELAIFDEMQMAKNKQSQVHKSLKLVNSKMKIGLTGTPVENYLSELKALFDIILPGYFPSDLLFRELFANPIEKYQDEEKKALLHQLIKPFVMRRKKTEVLQDLPEKIEEIAHIDLSDDQRLLYKQVYFKESSFLQNAEKLDNQSFYTHVFALITALKQICDHPALFLKEPGHYRKYQSAKFELFKELIEEARRSGQKVVVFTQYLDMMNIIESYLEEEEIGYAEIRGSTKDRRQQVMTFKEDPKCEVFVASLQAAGVGIDLVAASVVIHYDRWWNPAKEDQATDRVHRIGQVRGVQVFKLVTKHTIEEHIHRLIEKKIDLIQTVIGYDASEAIKKFDREELIELLRQVQRDIHATDIVED